MYCISRSDRVACSILESDFADQPVHNVINELVDTIRDLCARQMDVLVDGKHVLSPFEAERLFRDRAHIAADGHQAQAAAGDDGVAHFAHAGGNGDGKIRIGGTSVFFRQNADCDPSGFRRSLRRGCHDAAAPAADHRETRLRQNGGNLTGRACFMRSAIARPDNANRLLKSARTRLMRPQARYFLNALCVRVGW